MDRSPTEAPASNGSSNPASAWVTYLTGKKVSAESFLRQVHIVERRTGSSKAKTHKIIKPDETAKSQFIEALAANPDRIERLLALVQESISGNDALRDIVMELAEAAIRRLGVFSASEQLNPTTFSQTVASRLAGTTDKTIKPATINSLLLLTVYIEWYRQRVDHDTALKLLASAATMMRSSQKRKRTTEAAPALLEVLLTTRVMSPMFHSLLALYNESSIMIQEKNEQISHLRDRNEILNSTIVELHAEIDALLEQKQVADMTIAKLEKEVVDVRASYQHKLDDVRGRVRGILQGQVRRWLETSLDATQANPPRIEVIQERLEETLKLIERELRWLQPSA